MEKMSTLCVTGGRAPPNMAGRVGSMMLMKGGRTGRLDQPSLEVEPGCCMQTSANRTVPWHTEDSNSAWCPTCLARRIRCVTKLS